MTTAGQLIFLHAIMAAIFAYAWASFRTQLPRWTYRWRMKSSWRQLLMPFGLSCESKYLRFHRLIVVFGCIFAVFVYIAVMLKILRRS